MKIIYRVFIIESERGWGQRVDSKKDFFDAESAFRFVHEFNSKNTSTAVTDCYMFAEDPIMIRVDDSYKNIFAE